MADDHANLLDAALRYHRDYGLCVIPANAKTKKGAVRWAGYQTKRPTENQVKQWFSSGKYNALAVVGGAVSGDLVILDFDSAETWRWWNENHADKHLPMESTTRGGHVLMRWPGCRTQKPEQQDVELRSELSITLISPSPHKHWIVEPNGEIPVFAMFSLGLERFSIAKSENRNFPAGGAVCDAQELTSLQIGGKSFAGRTSDRSSTHFTEEGLTERGRREKDGLCPLSVKCPTALSETLSEFDEQARRDIEHAIMRTLPQGPKQRNRLVFHLCQRLKGIPAVCDRPASQLREVVREWHRQALPVINTKDFDSTWADFVHARGRVRWAKGALLRTALDRAATDTRNPPEAALYEDPRNQLLVRLCWQLQQVNPPGPFFLSCRDAGWALGVSHTEAACRLEMLLADEILEVAERYTNLKATRYYYIRHGKEK